MATPPSLTPEQRTAALAKAAEARTARAELKNRLKLGSLSLAEALASNDSTVGKLKVVSLLESLPGVGKVKARKIMDEIGIDISKHKPHTFAELEDDSFDVIITLSPEAHHTALEYTRTSAVEVIYWPTIDATAVQGSREQMMEAYRGVRDNLQKRIKDYLDWRPMMG